MRNDKRRGINYNLNIMEQRDMEKGQLEGKGTDESTIEEMARCIKKEEKKEWMLPASIVFAATVISAAFIYAGGPSSAAPAVIEEPAPQIVESDVVLGNPDAKVTIIEYGDFQCPYCGKFFTDAEPFIKSAFIDTGKAKLIYKPLAFLGQESEDAVAAVECAQEQGKFWEMHDAIFSAEYKEVEQMIARKIESSENNGNLNLDLFKKLGAGFGLDQDAFAACYASGRQSDKITAYMQEAQEVMQGKISTPTVYINGKKVDISVLYNKQALTQLIDGLNK